MNYHAELEYFDGGVVRVFAEGDEYGDPYAYALPFVIRERFEEPEESGRIGFIEYVGVNKQMTPSIARAIYEASTAEGWGVLSTRIKDGVEHTVEVTRIYWDHREYEARCGDTGTNSVATDGQEPEPASGAGAGEEQTDNTEPGLG